MGANKLSIAALVFTASCSLHSDPIQSERLDVTRNDLGLVAIEITHFEDQGDAVFELRGVDGNDDELAAVRLRTGEIADLPSYLPGTATTGSELIISVSGHDTRTVSRELFVHQLQPQAPAMQSFLELEVVSSALARENILVARTPTQDAESSYIASACLTTELMTTPVAGQCCINGADTGFGTLFINYGQDSVVYRAGLLATFAIDDHLEAVGLLVIPVVSPDSIGIAGGDFGELGSRYRWATGQHALP